MTIVSSSRPFVGRPDDRQKPVRWQQVLKEAVRDVGELYSLLGLAIPRLPDLSPALDQFPVFVPRGYLARMRKGDPHDPLLRQVLPIADEQLSTAGFTTDPVAEAAAVVTPGLLQKYAGRVLMVTTGACAVHCRYCFRRHFPYAQAPKSIAAWEPALRAIAADDSIHEVILSGGDPLTLVDSLLTDLAEQLVAIPHLRRLRIHTRLPIVVPERVCSELLAWFCGTRLAPVMVVHANHPAELDADVAAALAKLVDAGVPVLNQSVLLRGVNDDADTLAELCERLVDLRVMPYYLHQLDPVAGAAHFEVPEARGRQLMDELRVRLPGYAVPRYVREIPGELCKTPISDFGLPIADCTVPDQPRSAVASQSAIRNPQSEIPTPPNPL